MISVSKGLDIPLKGVPSTEFDSASPSELVGITGPDFVGMKPSILVKPGEKVKIGQPLFACKKNEGLVFTSPASGEVVEVKRGERRVFQTFVIRQDGSNTHQSFSKYSDKSDNDADSVRALLVESGLWASLRERPFDKTPSVSGDLPNSIFVSIADTQPAAPDPIAVVTKHNAEFDRGLTILEKLCKKHLYVCSAYRKTPALPLHLEKLVVENVQGPHPAGNVGTQMHFLSPPSLLNKVWHVGYQDVIAIGHLFATGKLFTTRYVGTSGPLAKNPRIIATHIGADLRELCKAERTDCKKPLRAISGSILNGRSIAEPFHFLGAFHNQISLIEENDRRELLGWHLPGFKKFSSKGVFVASKLPGVNFDISTSTHGSPRALVPFGHFEGVCPMDTLPTHLLRALLSKDTDAAQDLGVLELSEEDMSLFTFVSTGKTDFGPILRENLDLIEKEG